MSFIKVDQVEIRIEASHFIKHDGYLHRIGLLSRSLHNLKSDIADKRLIFDFSDGEPIAFTAFDRVTEILSKNLELEPDRLIYRLVDHTPRLQSSWATIQTYPSKFFYETKKSINLDLFNIRDDAKLFGAAFGRFAYCRFLMAHYLETKFPNDNFVIFQPGKDFVDFELSPDAESYQEQLDWFKSRHDNRNLQGNLNGCVGALDCLPVYHEIFSKYLIEVVIETNTISEGWFTEKTCKCLASGKPFVLYGTPGQLARLREIGFRTFNPIINESYDVELDHETRFDMICQELDRIHANRGPSLIKELDSIAQWNRDNYSNIVEKYYNDYSD